MKILTFLQKKKKKDPATFDIVEIFTVIVMVANVNGILTKIKVEVIWFFFQFENTAVNSATPERQKESLHRHSLRPHLSFQCWYARCTCSCCLCYNYVHRVAHKQLAANYSHFNYFTCCPLWWLLWPFFSEHLLRSAFAVLPFWRLLAPMLQLCSVKSQPP